ncbi:MAG: hypothetical protein ACKOTF_07395 [Opitutaceae bacterium]
MVLVTDVGMADRILRIDFIPDAEDPENRGRAIIVGVRVNDQRDVVSPPAPLIASYHPFPYPFGWSGYGWNGYYYGFGWDPYYGYGNTYFDGYTYATPTLNPRRPKPPHGSRPPDGLAHHHRHPQPPEDPLRPRRTVPPAEEPRPPLLAAARGLSPDLSDLRPAGARLRRRRAAHEPLLARGRNPLQPSR